MWLTVHSMMRVVIPSVRHTHTQCNTPDYTHIETMPGVDYRLYIGIDPGGAQNLPLPLRIYSFQKK